MAAFCRKVRPLLIDLYAKTRGCQNELLYPPGLPCGVIQSEVAALGRAHERKLRKAQMVGQRINGLGIGNLLGIWRNRALACARLVGRDDTKSCCDKSRDLVFPDGRMARPWMEQHDWLAGTSRVDHPYFARGQVNVTATRIFGIRRRDDGKNASKLGERGQTATN